MQRGRGREFFWPPPFDSAVLQRQETQSFLQHRSILPLPPGRSSQIRCDFCQAFVNDFIDFLHLSIFWLVFF
ncbi:hypothetical protein GK107_14910 [Geobacillus thermoleovorans]|nr:hypothetical protein GK107_14910 [Geobacillus thermoleovorans]